MPPGSALVAKLEFNRDATMVVLGDSTSNDWYEWVGEASRLLPSRFPHHRIVQRTWSDGDNAYGAATVVSSPGPDAPVLTIYNGSMPGARLLYHSERLALMVPSRPDLVVVNVGHNYKLAPPEQFLDAVRSVVAQVRASYAGTEVLVSSQNPQFPGVWGQAEADAHAARNEAVRTASAQEGWGYLGATEQFLGRSDGGRSWVAADGIHPIYSDNGPDGNDAWAAAAVTYLQRLSLRQ